MPYLQLFLKGRRLPWEPQIAFSPDLGGIEAEAREKLQELRAQFPLQQSEGNFYRMNADSILFEQPEHMALTLEQDIWLEQHGYDPHVDIKFYQDRTQGCQICGLPFDGVPEGFIGGFRCQHAGNPYRLTFVSFPCSSAEFNYIQGISRQRYDIIETVYIREMTLTLIQLIEQAQDRSRFAGLFAADSLSSRVAKFLGTDLCLQCNQPLTCCSCPRQENTLGAVFTYEEYARLQTLAQHYGLTPQTFVRSALGILEVQFAYLSSKAATGQVLSCNLSFLQSYLAQPEQPVLRRGKHRLPNPVSFGPPDGPQMSFKTFHLTAQAMKLADALPILADLVLPMLMDIPGTLPSSSPLGWCKAQLEQLDPMTCQQIRPCMPLDIAELERACHLTLPSAYKEFLSWMGYGAGPFLQYLNCFFPALSIHQHTARALLAHDASPATLPDDAFVFHCQSDDSFAFFRTSEGNDPPVYAHRRDWRVKPFQKIFYRFSDFLSVQLALYLTYQQPGRVPLPLKLQMDEDVRARFFAMQERVQNSLKPRTSQQ